MNRQTMIEEIENEIKRLSLAKACLIGEEFDLTDYKVFVKTKEVNNVVPIRRRVMSPAARRRISMAQKKRWAQVKRRA